jgi:hypothetical protein
MDLVAELKMLLEKYERREDNLTIEEFCAEENFSRIFFKTLQARGLAPEVRRYPGLSLQRAGVPLAPPAPAGLAD